MKVLRVSARETLLHMCIAVVALCCGSACVLYEFAQPLVSPDGGRSMVFDPVALGYATFIIVALAILSWLPIVLFLPRRPSVPVAVLISALTFLLLWAVFWLIENVVGPPQSSQGLYARATRILGDGRDMAFLPLVAPLISILSGAFYTCALWLSILLLRNSNSGRTTSPEN